MLPPAGGRARFVASAWDYAVILAWLAALALLGFLVRPLLPEVVGDPDPLAFDAVGFVLSVLPVWLYLTVAEAGGRQATWGKRRVGLQVVRQDGSRAGVGTVAARSAVKLLPWQLAHLSVSRAILGVDAPLFTGVTYGLSLLLPVVSVGMAWRDGCHRALHDRLAGTLVVSGARTDLGAGAPRTADGAASGV